jgi:hypothetical protein
VCYSPDLDVWVATGTRGDAMFVAFSRHGNDWALLPTTVFGGNEGRTCAWGRDKFVIGGSAGGGSSGNVAYSYDGQNWQAVAVAGFTFDGVAYSNQQGVWAGVGQFGGLGAVVTSQDGIMWTVPANALQTDYVADVAWSNFDRVWAFVVQGNASDVRFYSTPDLTPGANPTPTIPAVGIPTPQSLVALETGGFLALVGANNEVWGLASGATTWTHAFSLGNAAASMTRGICAFQSTVVAIVFDPAAQKPSVYQFSSSGTGLVAGPVASSGNTYSSNIGSVTSRSSNVVGASFGNGTFTVALSTNATIVSPFAFVAGSLVVYGNLTFVGNAFVSVNQTLFCGPSSVLALVVRGPGAFVVASYGSLSGTFGKVRADDGSSTCYDAVPTYTASTLAVTVSVCPGSNNNAATIGIIVGSVVGGVALAVLIVVGTVIARNRYVANVNLEIRMDEMEHAKMTKPQ